MTKQIFLSHNWGVNEEGEDNHNRVKYLKNILNNQYGWTTWFDEDDMEWNIDGSMYKGISQCALACVFLTKKYIFKIENNNLDFFNRDNCAKEWNLINIKKKPVLPIGFEKGIKNINNWENTLIGMYLANHFIFDMHKITNENIYRLNKWIIDIYSIEPKLNLQRCKILENEYITPRQNRFICYRKLSKKRLPVINKNKSIL
jgi:hypothetical protein